MKPILYEAGATQFNTNGLGRLSDAVSCTVTEARNGAYELSMTYPVGGIHFHDIKEGRVIYAYNDDAKEPQPFDIYSVSKPSFGNISIKARHACYRLSGFVVKPWTTTEGATYTAQEVLTTMKSQIIGTCPFAFQSDIADRAAIVVPTVPVTAWALFGNSTENCLLTWFDGEYEYDAFTVKLLQERGKFSDVKIRRAKNVTGLTITASIEDRITAIVPYWQGTDLETGADVLITIPGDGSGFGVVYAAGAESLENQVMKPIDFSDSFDTKPTTAQLQAAATEWLRRNTYNTQDSINYAVSIVKDSEAIEALSRLHLCDYVTVEDEILALRTKLKVISLTYDVLAERVTAIQLGTPRRALSLTLKYGSSTAAANGVTEKGTASGNSSGTSAAKQTTVNAAKIKALEKAVADLSQGGSGNSSSVIMRIDSANPVSDMYQVVRTITSSDASDTGFLYPPCVTYKTDGTVKTYSDLTSSVFSIERGQIIEVPKPAESSYADSAGYSQRFQVVFRVKAYIRYMAETFYGEVPLSCKWNGDRLHVQGSYIDLLSTGHKNVCMFVGWTGTGRGTGKCAVVPFICSFYLKKVNDPTGTYPDRWIVDDT